MTTNTAEAGLVGVVGLGAMGLPLASALHASGARLVGFDVDADARARAAAQGLEVEHDLAELARRARSLVLSLPTPAVVTAVVETVADAAAEGLLVLDTSTIDPATARAAAMRLESVGASYADCPVLGRPAAVGRWTLPLGGSVEALERARVVLAPVTREIVHVGAVGAGHTLKLVNNMMLATINAVTAEALVLAEAAGLDPGVFVDTVMGSGAASVSGLFLDVAPRAVDGDFDATFSVRLMRKDNALALALAAECDVPLSVATAAQTLTTAAVAAGYGDEDSIAVVKTLEALTGRVARRR